MKTTLLLIIAIAITTFSQAQERIEIKSKRSKYSKSFVLNNGTKEEIISPKPIHYKNNDEWLEINTDLISTDEQFVNTENSIHSTFPTLLNSESVVEIEHDGFKISIEAMKHIVTYDELTGLEHLNKTFSPSNGAMVDNKITYNNVFDGYSDRFTVSAGEIKNDFIINSIPQEVVSLSEGYFGFQERFVLPSNWSLEPMVVQNSDLIRSGINILDENNNHILSIPAPVFYDDLGMTNDGASMVEGAFIIDKDASGWLLSTVVPVSWLNDPTVVYPVVLDPTVTIGGWTGGWQSQNNYVDNPGFVFIGVCCGNMEHRAWVKWYIQSIPDAACVTSVEMQIFVNGVGSTSPELVHAYDMMATTPGGLFGPYGAIVPAAYNDMGNGLYTSFTLTGTGYYGYYDLGPNAVADLTSMLSLDWYEVAMIFDNEPSTAWKRLTGGNCNLRVTYDDPPCAPLPVGMVNFETECVNDQAQLTWSTVSESNSDYFTVWKSTDGQEYEEVGQVQANGNSTAILNYRWTDLSENNDVSYYKLTQTDLDGTIEEFDTKIYSGCDKSEPIVYIDETNDIRIRGNNITKAVFRDNMGRVVATELNSGDKNEFHLTDNSFVAGTYSVTVTYDSGKHKTLKFFYSKE